MKYKAIFFDRDGTLTDFNKKKEIWRDQKISQWSGKPFKLSYEKMMGLFHLASEGKKPWYKMSLRNGSFSKGTIDTCLLARGFKRI